MRRFAALLLLSAAACGLFWLYAAPKEGDRKKYLELLHSSLSVKEERGYSATQKRLGVRKDILYSDDKGRLQLSIQSDDGALLVQHRDEETQIVENLDHFVCVMQEELFYRAADGTELQHRSDGRMLLRGSETKELLYPIEELEPMQSVRLLYADKARYYYGADRLTAKNVKISRYLLDGHALPTVEQVKEGALLMEGIADSVTFTVKRAAFDFKANRLKATFYEPRRGI